MFMAKGKARGVQKSRGSTVSSSLALLPSKHLCVVISSELRHLSWKEEKGS